MFTPSARRLKSNPRNFHDARVGQVSEPDELLVCATFVLYASSK